MKESKKAILKELEKVGKKNTRFDIKVLNLALQKIDGDIFEFDGEAVYTDDHKRLVYCMSQAESFTIPSGVEVIGEMAFRRKKELKNVIIPSTVKEIEHDAFFDCDSLDNVFIPASVTTIRGYSFSDCDNLKKVTFEGVPKHLSSHTFEDSDNLHNIIVPAKSLKKFQKALRYDGTIDEYLFTEKSITDNNTQDDGKANAQA